VNILFFGELYPDVVHGVSIANRLNVDLLSTKTEVDLIQEKTKVDSIGKVSFDKVKSLLINIWRIWKYSRVKEYDLFYTVLPLSVFGLVKSAMSIYSFRKKGSGKVILHLHRGDFSRFYGHSRLNRFLVLVCFRKTSQLIVLSEEQKKEMASYFPLRLIEVLENSVLEEKEFSPFSSAVSIKNRFVFVSNYIREKGIYDLLVAFGQLDNHVLECFGAFNGNEGDLRSLAGKNIFLNSAIDNKKKFQILKEASAVILPSWNEGQPIIILEAMLLGTPVLTTKVGLIEELLGKDYPFYFDPKNPRSLSSCVAKFTSYSDKESVSIKLKQRYFEFYSNDVHKKKLFRIFGLGDPE
jgi:glycosyltransferase involved in cell wall biosynthesis